MKSNVAPLWAPAVGKQARVCGCCSFPLQPPPLSYPNPIVGGVGGGAACSTCERPHFGWALNALQMTEWGWHRGHSFIMWKIETDRRAQGGLMWLLKGCGAEKKKKKNNYQNMDHRSLGGASLESPGTARYRQTGRGMDGADSWRGR